MSGSINKVILVGNLGNDPDVRRTQGGQMIVNLSVATSESWKDRNTGERKEKTEWHRVVVFGEGLGKFAENYLRKGSKVYAEGQLQTRKWTDQSGNDRYSTEVVLQGYNCVLKGLDSPPDSSRQPQQHSETQSGYGAPSGDDMDDDIPFAMEWR